jgi:hypothetical protein
MSTLLVEGEELGELGSRQVVLILVGLVASGKVRHHFRA